MGKFLIAAMKTLKISQYPMTVKEIIDYALKHNLLVTRSNNPKKTINSILSTNIVNLDKNSSFMRTAHGKFGLREWKEKYIEYFPKRFKKKPFDEDIVVFNKKHLYKIVESHGLHKMKIPTERLLAIAHTMRSKEAEENIDVIQLVSAFIATNNSNYLTYKRSKRSPESSVMSI